MKIAFPPADYRHGRRYTQQKQIIRELGLKFREKITGCSLCRLKAGMSPIFRLNAEVEDGISGRPQNPLVFVAMDETSKMILDLSVLEAHQREVDAAVGFFIRFLKLNGKMRCIKARNPWIFSALTELCEYCGVELIRDPLKPTDIALEDFREHMSLF